MNQSVGTQVGFDKKTWSRFESEGKKHLKSKDYGLYRNTRLHMAQYLQSVQDFEGAIAMYSEVLFWDLSGCDNGFNYETFIDSTFPMLFPYDRSLIVIASAVLRETEKCKTKIGLTDEQLKELILKSVKKLSAPVHIFSPSEIADMYFWERDSKKAKMKKVFADAKKRFNPKKPQAMAKM